MARKICTYAELDSFLVKEGYSHSNRLKFDQTFLSPGAVVSLAFFDTDQQPIETRTYTLVECMQFNDNSQLLNRPQAVVEGSQVMIEDSLMSKVFGFRVISSPLELCLHEGKPLFKWEPVPPWYH